MNRLEKIWEDWETFGLYAFNKAHYVSYTIIAFQLAYLKAHYPLEYSMVVTQTNY
ncbi:MAG: hypothetical protein V4553_17705 [Bacteroidota bacterium]